MTRLFVTFVESSYLNTDVRTFESSQKEESRAQSADSSKACSKPRALNSPMAMDRIASCA